MYTTKQHMLRGAELPIGKNKEAPPFLPCIQWDYINHFLFFVVKFLYIIANNSYTARLLMVDRHEN